MVDKKNIRDENNKCIYVSESESDFPESVVD